jgi:hypothetical protein
MSIALTPLVAGACEAGGRGSRSASSPASSPASAKKNVAARAASSGGSAADSSLRDGDGDVDRLSMTPSDTDNDAVPEFGPPAGPADRRAMLGLIGRYYAAAAAGDGARACSMLYALTIESILEEHHHDAGPVARQRDTCRRVMSGLFRQRRRELQEDIARPYNVLSLQVQGNRGYALVRFPAKHELREVQLRLHRDQGGWKMAVALDNGAQ